MDLLLARAERRRDRLRTCARCWRNCAPPERAGCCAVSRSFPHRFAVESRPWHDQLRTKATLSFSDGTPSLEMPIYKGTIGPDVIDIRKLYGADRQVHLRPGLHVDRLLQLAITYIDGDKGELLYRGYPIEQLAVNCDFLEICYLLLNGELPNADAEEGLRPPVTQPHDGARADAVLPPRLPPRRASDGGPGRAWSARCRRSTTTRWTSTTREHRAVSAIRLIAKLPTLVAHAPTSTRSASRSSIRATTCRTPRTSCT